MGITEFESWCTERMQVEVGTVKPLLNKNEQKNRRSNIYILLLFYTLFLKLKNPIINETTLVLLFQH